jgi:ribokinase
LREAGVDLDGVTATDAPTGLAAITIDADGENTIALAGGANRRVSADLIAGVAFTPADTLLLQMEVDRAATLAAARQAHAAGARVMLSLAPFTLLAPDDFNAVDIVLVNETEAAQLARHCGVALDDEVANAGALARRLGVTLVATLGPRGALAAAPDGPVITVPALPVRPVDTTAAGDTFAGVLAAGLDAGLGFEGALRRAAVAGSLACLTLGAQTSMPTRSAIEAALAGDVPASG